MPSNAEPTKVALDITPQTSVVMAMQRTQLGTNAVNWRNPPARHGASRQRYHQADIAAKFARHLAV